MRERSREQLVGRSSAAWERLLKQLVTFAVLMVGICAAAAGEQGPSLSLQSSSDVSSYGAFYTDVSATYSPFGDLWRPGWRVQGITSLRRYRFDDAGEKRIGLDSTLDLLGGYQFTRTHWSWLLAAGPSFVNSHVYAAPGLAASNVEKYGVKILSTVYGTPTPGSMLYLQAHYNTGSEFFYVQAKTGLAIAGNVFVGPEAAFSGSWTYDQFRLGGHISGLTMAGLSSSVSLGFVRDTNYGKGFYAGVNVYHDF